MMSYRRLARDYAINTLKSHEDTILSEVHKKCFSYPWSKQDFLLLLSDKTVFGFSLYARTKHEMLGFVLARRAVDEAEILTIAVLPDYRCSGLGWRLMHQVLEELHTQRVISLFLEVDETNHPALALYKRMGFHTVGKRENYYKSEKGKKPTNAFVMRRDIL